jgi:hypothetical protein
MADVRFVTSGRYVGVVAQEAMRPRGCGVGRWRGIGRGESVGVALM